MVSPPRRSWGSQVSAASLPLEQAGPGLYSPMVVTQGPKTTGKHLLLFHNWLFPSKERSTKSQRLKQKSHLSDLQVASCDKKE
ncbi:uncharacterized protein LOC117285984 [Fukomys damarensis]|uniref:uncharacterized protein LOC117285984 n=1 Tax=Fukomys damarensis TaxID=885580 RepID=UPI0014558F4B|nr:uncharacterized protein LOC117285984 [Fukomys damarensis]